MDILTPWICGSGKGSGKLHDAVGVRDEAGLPYVPGRHLKGLLRDAVERMPELTVGGDAAGGEELATFLFGPRASADIRESAADYFFGLLQISSASLSTMDRASLLGLSDADRERALFVTAQSTAIDCETGTARDKTLRSSQLAVPMPVYAIIGSDPSPFADRELHPFEKALVAGEWKTVIRDACALVRSIGANRQRGAGRVVVSIFEDAAA
jgi:hypothetical protein